MSTTTNLFPVSEFTTCPQAKKLVERYGDGSPDGMQGCDQAALLLVLAAFVYRHFAKLSTSIQDAAEQAIPENADRTSDEMPDVLEMLDGIQVGDAVGLIQFLVQEE
jgi:hypothetical protein